jgi:outer membrane protein OmpA-like peptidoglycan-associated protein
MLGAKIAIRRRTKDEAEKPFWISFADLMSALMVLFLVVMSVALLSVTKTLSERELQEQQLNQDIDLILARFVEATKRFPGITVNSNRRVIDFGRRAQFGFNSSSLTQEQQRLLREFVPEILTRANDELGRRVLKRVVVEGFADKTGSYLSNLNLSLQRSQRVLCAMFGKPLPTERALTEEEREQIRALFLVGGYSFNAAKDTDEESRRVEMRLEFLGIGEQRPTPTGTSRGNLGVCALSD